MKKLNKFLYLLAIIKFALPYFLQHPVYEPHRDEFLYLAEGMHPAFGYMEVPPMLSVFAWITQQLGNNMFWTKCWPSLIGAFNLVLIGKIVISEGGKRFALFLVFCSFIFTSYLRVHFLFQPNAFEIFFYTVIAYGLIRYVRTSDNKWLYVTALGAGLGMLSKYSVAFYLVALIPALLLSNHRRIFLNKHLYFALGMAVIIFLPNLLWQRANHFPVFFHMEELTSTQLRYVPASSFIKDQFLMLLPCVYIWVTGFFYLLLNPKGKAFQFLCWAYLGVIAILLWFHGKNYYALGLYPILLGFGSLAIEQWTTGRRLILRYVFSAFTILFGIYFITIGLPVMKPDKLAAYYEKTDVAETGALKWEDLKNHPLPQDFADMLGWEEMAQITARTFQAMDSNTKSNTMIFCDNYGMAGALNYYRKKYELPVAYSDNASFLYWIPDSLHYENIIIITDDQDEMKHDFIKEFKQARVVGSVSNPYAREYGSLVILMEGASEKFRAFFKAKIKEDRLKTSPH